MRYALSKIIPMRMRSTYMTSHADEPLHHERSTWWQWRGRVFAHHVFALAMLVAFALTFVLVATASAATGDATTPGFFDGITVTSVALLLSIVLPLIVAVITKYESAPVVKGVVLAVLAGVAALVAALTGTNAPDTVTLNFVLSTFFTAFVASVGAYFGLLRTLNPGKHLAPEFGFGRKAA